MRLRHAMVDASDFHGQGVDRQCRDELIQQWRNSEITEIRPGGDGEAM